MLRSEKPSDLVIGDFGSAHVLSDDGESWSVSRLDCPFSEVVMSLLCVSVLSLLLLLLLCAGFTTNEDTTHVVGTSRWCAPEHLGERRASKSGDVYMLGGVLHEILSGTCCSLHLDM